MKRQRQTDIKTIAVVDSEYPLFALMVGLIQQVVLPVRQMKLI
jgi:hypothetical protein